MADTDREFRSGFIAIVGRPNVGKSTLLNHLIGQKISITSRKAQTTRHRIHGIHTDAHTQFVFVDTPGFQTKHLNALNRGMNRVVTSSLRDVQVVMYVLEALHYDERDREVLKLLPDNRPVLLVINKIDQVSDKGQLLPHSPNGSGRISNFPTSCRSAPSWAASWTSCAKHCAATCRKAN